MPSDLYGLAAMFLPIRAQRCASVISRWSPSGRLMRSASRSAHSPTMVQAVTSCRLSAT